MVTLVKWRNQPDGARLLSQHSDLKLELLIDCPAAMSARRAQPPLAFAASRRFVSVKFLIVSVAAIHVEYAEARVAAYGVAIALNGDLTRDPRQQRVQGNIFRELDDVVTRARLAAAGRRVGVGGDDIVEKRAGRAAARLGAGVSLAVADSNAPTSQPAPCVREVPTCSSRMAVLRDVAVSSAGLPSCNAENRLARRSTGPASDRAQAAAMQVPSALKLPSETFNPRSQSAIGPRLETRLLRSVTRAPVAEEGIPASDNPTCFQSWSHA